MKKFSFSLQRLLNYKEQVLDSERAVLAEMNALLRKYQKELDDLKADLLRRSREFNEKVMTGMLPSEIATHKSFTRMQESAIEAKIKQIELQRLAVDKQTDKVRAVKIEISSMEKLREKRLEEYNFAVNKADEQFIEEFVSNAKAMTLNG